MTVKLENTIGDPIVGKYYLVPAIWYKFFERVTWWPVLGPPHEDGELLEFPYQHYHHDWRFTPWCGYNRARDGYGRFSADARPFAWPLMRHGEPVPEFPTLKRLQCKRRMKMPAELTKPGQGFSVVQKHFAGHTVKEGPHGLICPHRGAPLHTISPDEDGVVTCLLHGLRICTRTRTVLPP